MVQWTQTNMDMEIQSGADMTRAPLTAMETKLHLAKRIITDLKQQLANLERLLDAETEAADLESLVRVKRSDDGDYVGPMAEGKIVEGVFDGRNMIGSDGRQYIVPPNYASKSKLVEGDILKLTIQTNGTFLFKQIGPIERQRVVGMLAKDELTNDWLVVHGGRKYCVLTAAVSYHKGDVGDDAVLLIPKAAPSKWAALENVVKNDGGIEA